jgi:SAM-dependent methyltransferase
VKVDPRMPRTRNSLVHLAQRAVARPDLIVPYVRRRLRNYRIRRTARSHPEFYRAVMADDVRRRSAQGAVGTPSRERWLALGKLQYDYLVAHGLEPHHRLLEIGCGNLRAGWRFITYLDPDRYTGVDISPDIIIAAHRTVVDQGLQAKTPRVTVIDGTTLDFLPDASYDVMHAHSVFSHTPLDVVEAYLRQAWRLLVPGGFFDFTYHRSEDGRVWDFLQEDYYFPVELLEDRARAIGFEPQQMTGWKHKQSKMRVTKPA